MPPAGEHPDQPEPRADLPVPAAGLAELGARDALPAVLGGRAAHRGEALGGGRALQRGDAGGELVADRLELAEPEQPRAGRGRGGAAARGLAPREGGGERGGELALQPGDLLAQVAAGGGLGRRGDGRRARRRRRCGRRSWRAWPRRMLRPRGAAGPYWTRAPQRPDGHGRPVHRPAPRHGAGPLPHAAAARLGAPPPRRRGARRGRPRARDARWCSAPGARSPSAGSGSARRSTTGPDSVFLGITVAFLGLVGTLILTLVLATRLDHLWRLLRRAAGHDQRDGALGRIFMVTADRRRDRLHVLARGAPGSRTLDRPALMPRLPRLLQAVRGDGPGGGLPRAARPPRRGEAPRAAARGAARPHRLGLVRAAAPRRGQRRDVRAAPRAARAARHGRGARRRRRPLRARAGAGRARPRRGRAAPRAPPARRRRAARLAGMAAAAGPRRGGRAPARCPSRRAWPEGEARDGRPHEPGRRDRRDAPRATRSARCAPACRTPRSSSTRRSASSTSPVQDAAGLVGELDNLVVVRSFSKGHAMAGLRAGAALGPPGLVGGLSPSGGISAPAAAAIAWAVSEPGIAAAERRRAVARALHEQLAEGLAGTPFAAAPAATPFAWLSSGEEDGRAIAARLAASQVFVAPGSLWGDERHVRAQLRGPRGRRAAGQRTGGVTSGQRRTRARSGAPASRPSAARRRRRAARGSPPSSSRRRPRRASRAPRGRRRAPATSPAALALGHAGERTPPGRSRERAPRPLNRSRAIGARELRAQRLGLAPRDALGQRREGRAHRPVGGDLVGGAAVPRDGRDQLAVARRVDAPAGPPAPLAEDRDQPGDEQGAHEQGVDQHADDHQQRELAERPQRHEGEQREGGRERDARRR